MMRIKLRQAIDDYAFVLKRRVTLGEVAAGTGLSLSTLTRMSADPCYNAELAAIDALCRFLKIQPGELLEYVPDGKVKDPKRK